MNELEFQDKQLQPADIFDLREITVEELGQAAERLFKAENKDTMTVESRQDGMFDYDLVTSGANRYEVVRMGLFARCSCPGFAKGHKACKHLAFVMPPYCRRCFTRPAPELAGLCSLCGPGELLPVGTRLTIHKYYGVRSVFEVAESDHEKNEVVMYDITHPEESAVEPTRYSLSLATLDLYRSKGELKIVNKGSELD